MNDENHAYRRGRPLADIIPPDRRRLKAAGLVIAGMVFGAMLLISAQIWARRSPPPPRSPEIRSFALGSNRSDVTSPGQGAIERDGKPDWSFDLVVDGPVWAIVLAHSDEANPIPNGRHWGTIAWDPTVPDGGASRYDDSARWQLAVFEGTRSLNEPAGGLAALGEGRHHLTLHASMTTLYISWRDYIPQGGHVRAYVVGPNYEIVASAPVWIPIDQWAPPEQPPAPSPTAAGPPFDRGAAAASLGSVQLDRCAKLAGANDGRVAVTFAPNGSISEVSVIEGVDPRAPAARCVADAFRNNARVPPFAGAPVHVKKSFSLGDRAHGAQ